MKKHIRILGLAALVALTGLPAAAECYADYKAKRDDPLKLHYGVIALPDAICGIAAARVPPELSPASAMRVGSAPRAAALAMIQSVAA